MKFLNWLTDKLQVKVLLAMVALAVVALYCIYHAVASGMGDTLIPVATFALGAMSGIAKDLLAPPPGDSEGYRLAEKMIDAEED